MKDKKILIVDDSGSMRRVLEDILHTAGYTNIINAATGEDALLMCEKEKPDLVLLDIIMAGVNGMDVLAEIGKSTKVLIVSAVGQKSMIEQAKKLGAIDYLVKPITKDDVLTKVAQHLK